MGDAHDVTVEERRREEISEIGRAVKVARNARGWSLRRLAENAGLSASLLSAVETGKIVPTVGSLFAISDAFGEPVETFFPARRRPTVPGRDDTVSDRPDSREGHHEVETGTGQQGAAVQDLVSDEPEPASHPIPPPSPPTASPPASPVRGDPTGSVSESEQGSFEKAGPSGSRRSVLRPKRIVSQRGDRAPGAGTVPIGSAPTHGPDSSTGPPSAEGASLVPDHVRDVPGVAVRRANDRPRMVLDNGTTWTLPVDEHVSHDAMAKVIEVSIPSGQEPSFRFQSRDRATVILVTQGRLRVDAAFMETRLEIGDSAVIGAGVPHRLSGDQAQSTTYLAFVSYAWDGTL